MLDRSRSRDRSKTGGAFSPAGLFVTGAQGAWYDPSDYSTLFQNASGTTPVTAVEQPVRLMLDRSRGLVLGAELRGGGTVSTIGTPSPVATYDATTGAATLNRVDGSNSSGVEIPVGGTGKTIRVNITIQATTGTVQIRGFNVTGSILATVGSGAGTYELYVQSVTLSIFVVMSATATATITINSIRELPGNHATAPNDASRPILRARYNLLTFSEQFDNAAWIKGNNGTGLAPVITANAGLAPDGTMTADRAVFSLGGGTTSDDRSTLAQSGFAGVARTFSVYLKSFDGNSYTVQVRAANLENVIVTADWQRFTVSVGAGGVDATNWIALRGNAALTNSNTADVLIWGAQLLTAADQSATGGAYQRVAAATDYDTSNPVWRPYLAFDGSDDSMSTSSIDFSGTDEMTVFAGVTRLSSASTGILTELSTSVTTVNGSFAIVDRGLLDATTNGDYGVRSRGTTTVSVAGTTLTVPTTSVLTMLSDISAPSLSLAVNGAPYVSSTSTQGTGNFANAALFIGRRNNTSNPFNGRLYSLAVLGRTATAAELSAMETWIAGKTGVNLP